MNVEFSDSLGMRLRRAYQALHRRTNAELRRDFGVTADQFVVLNLLAEDDGVSQQQLCRRCASDPSTMGALVRRMESRGWVRRRPDPADARARRVCLTSRGRALQRKLWKAAEKSFHAALRAAVSSAKQERMLSAALECVAAAMGPGPEERRR